VLEVVTGSELEEEVVVVEKAFEVTVSVAEDKPTHVMAFVVVSGGEDGAKTRKRHDGDGGAALRT